MHRFLLTLLALLSTSCSQQQDNDLPPGLRAGGFALEDSKQQVLERMQEQSIPFRIENGFVVYLNKDLAKVEGLIRQARYGDELKDNIYEMTIAADEIEKQLFIDAFEAQGIRYQLSKGDREWVFNWSQLYGPQVDIITQEVRLERYKLLKNN